jgi:hypothetical protein
VTAVKALLIDPEHRAVLNMVTKLGPERQASLYTKLRYLSNSKDILQVDETPA